MGFKGFLKDDLIHIVSSLQQVKFSPVSSTDKTGRNDITEILLKVALKPHYPNF